ncbi:hypothetical protein C8J56DRAFT_24327 [Mycena floridula]|nr:hypothetical protein C8J56DRAFT_24327 [Mycena floridula]
MLKVWRDKWKKKEEPETHSPQNSPSASDSRSDTLESASSFRAREATLGDPVDDDPTGDAISIILVYDGPNVAQENTLLYKLRAVDENESSFPRVFRASRDVLVQLGTSASDLVWRRALKDIEAAAPSWFEIEDGPSSDIASKSRIRDIVKDWDFTLPNLDPSSPRCNVTAKFLQLLSALMSCEPYGDSFRGIIFVQRRAVAYALTELIRTLNEMLPFIRPHALVGAGQTANATNQDDILRNFSAGTYNLLISTKSAEDLEIPKAHVVICFDLFDGPISRAYIESCARGPDAHIVFMIQRGDYEQRRLVDRTGIDTELQKWLATVRKRPCRPMLPPASLRLPSRSYSSDSEDDDEDGEFLLDPTTGGRIYPHGSADVFYNFASRSGRKASHDPLFVYSDSQEDLGRPPRYVCQINLSGTPVDGLQAYSSISVALCRRLACYAACSKLMDAGLLDHRSFLLPQLPSRALDERLLPPLSDKFPGARCYTKAIPQFWNHCGSGTSAPGILYPTVISALFGTASARYAPIVILTRKPLPRLPSFKLFFTGVPSPVSFTQAEPFEVDGNRFNELSGYTLRICRAIANKPFTCSAFEMQYLIAPLPADWSPPKDDIPLVNVVDSIPWDLVSLACQKWAVPLKFGSAAQVRKDVKDAVIQDRWTEFTRRFIVTRVRSDLTPNSKPKDTMRDAEYANLNLVEYCKVHRKGFEGLKDYKQSIIEVARIQAIPDLLNPSSRPNLESHGGTRHLIPELCNKCTIPASTFRTALLLPAVTRRIDDFLLVKELNAKLLSHAVSEQHLHAAMTPPSAGIEYDYERLEMLGDSFLKYLASIYVFCDDPMRGEGALHMARQRIISNKILLLCGTSLGLGPWIQARHFSSKGWLPPNFSVERLGQLDDPDTQMTVEGDTSQSTAASNLSIADSSLAGLSPNASTDSLAATYGAAAKTKSSQYQKPPKRKRREENQWLGDKAIADVVESIIGAAFVTGGPDIAFNVTKALNVPIPNVAQWSDFDIKCAAFADDINTTRMEPESISVVQDIIGYRLKRPGLLSEALIHRSKQDLVERLEFIGDAILEFMVVRHLFTRFPHLSPGGLTMLKGAMVSNAALATICLNSGLASHVRVSDFPDLAEATREYATTLEGMRSKEYELAQREGRNPGQYWSDIEPIKPLSDAVESIIGALYISEDCSPVGAEAFFDKIIKPFLDLHVTLKTLSHHPTKILYELVQSRGCQNLEIVKEEKETDVTCLVLVHDVVLATAEGLTSVSAARSAAFSAIDALEGDAEFLTKTCDCRTRTQVAKSPKELVQVLNGFGDSDKQELI